MKIKSKNPFFKILIFSLCLLLTAPVVFAATNDFTADGNVTVTGVTFDATTADMLIFSGSTSESWDFSSGVFTVVNPGSAFKIGSSDTSVKGIKAVRGTIEYCENNSTPGTSSLTLNTTAGTYTITPLSGSCVGGSPSSNPAPSSGSGAGSTGEVAIGGTSNIGTVTTSGKNVFIYVNGQANFSTVVSGAALENHSFKVIALDLVKKKITLLFQSDPVTVELLVGETKKVDLDGDKINDIKVTFNNLIVNKIDLTITNISSSEELAAKNLVAGDLIKTATNPAVYYIDTEGKRHLFVNGPTFWTWYSGDWSKIMFGGAAKTIKNISQADFDNIGEAVHVKARPGSLIKFENSAKTYAVSSSGKIHNINDEATAKSLYGDNWLTKVKKMQAGWVVDYTMDSILNSISAYPDGSLIKWSGSNDIYYINGDQKQLVSTAAFSANGFKEADIRTAPSTVAYAAGSSISAAVATLTTIAGN